MRASTLFVAALAVARLAAADLVPVGVMVENRPSLVDPSAKYTLYVPTQATSGKPSPVLLIFDPRGRATLAAELFRAAADRHGWILVSSNDSRSDGPWEPNQKAIDALWPEIRLLGIDETRIYATGFSGGAIVSWFLAQATGQIAGIIAVGGRLPPEIPTKKLGFVHFGLAGIWDYNYEEMKGMDALVAKRGQAHRLEIMPGVHSWCSAEMAGLAVDWMELQAMRSHLRPVDPAFVEAAWLADTAAAKQLEASGNLLEAARRWRAIGRTFEGLRETRGATSEAERIEEIPLYRIAQRAEERADARARRYNEEVLPHLGAAFAAGALPSYEKLVRRLEVDRLLEVVSKGGAESEGANRTLAGLYAQTAGRILRQLVSLGRWRDAVTVLRVAIHISPESASPRLNLARAEAHLGHLDAALTALEEAIDRGYADLEALRTDPDLAALRENPATAERLEAVIRSVPPEPG